MFPGNRSALWKVRAGLEVVLKQQAEAMQECFSLPCLLGLTYSATSLRQLRPPVRDPRTHTQQLSPPTSVQRLPPRCGDNSLIGSPSPRVSSWQPKLPTTLANAETYSVVTLFDKFLWKQFDMVKTCLLLTKYFTYVNLCHRNDMLTCMDWCICNGTQGIITCNGAKLRAI